MNSERFLKRKWHPKEKVGKTKRNTKTHQVKKRWKWEKGRGKFKQLIVTTISSFIYFFPPAFSRASSFYKRKKKNQTLLIFLKSTCYIAIRSFFTCSFTLFCFTSLLNRTCLSDWRWAYLEGGRHLLSFIWTKVRWKLFTCKLCSNFYFAATWGDCLFFTPNFLAFSPFFIYFI